MFILLIATNLYPAQNPPIPITQDPEAFKNHLYEVLQREEKLLEQMEKSPYKSQMLQGYQKYQDKVDACRKKNGWPGHLDGTCLTCQKAFLRSNKKTQQYITQKFFRDEVAASLADVIDTTS